MKATILALCVVLMGVLGGCQNPGDAPSPTPTSNESGPPGAEVYFPYAERVFEALLSEGFLLFVESGRDLTEWEELELLTLSAAAHEMWDGDRLPFVLGTASHRPIVGAWAYFYLLCAPLGGAAFADDNRLAVIFEEAVMITEEEIAAKIPEEQHAKDPGPTYATEEERILRTTADKSAKLIAEGRLEEAKSFLAKTQEEVDALTKVRQGVRELRESYPTLKDFLNDVKLVGSYEDFLDLCESRGINPLP